MVVSVLENNQIGNGSRVCGNCCSWEEDLSVELFSNRRPGESEMVAS